MFKLGENGGTMRDKRTIVEIIIAGLLVFGVWSYTRYHRNEQVLNLQTQLQRVDNVIVSTTNLLQQGFDNGQLNIQNFINLGWQLNVKQPTEPQPDSQPSK
jgi:hypothetical protein